MFYIELKDGTKLRYPEGFYPGDEPADLAGYGYEVFPYLVANMKESQTVYVPATILLNDFPDEAFGEFSLCASCTSESNGTYYLSTSDPMVFTATAPASAAPDISDGYVTFAPNNSMQVSSKYGSYYLQGIASLKVDRDASKAEALYGATLTGWEMIIENQTYTAETENTLISHLLMNPGVVPVKFKQYDSRGLYTEISTEINVTEYAKPTISGVVVYRCNSDFAENEEGIYLSVEATGGISSVDGLNSFQMTARYGLRNQEYGAAVFMENGQKYLLGSGTIIINNSYNVLITVEDDVGGITTLTKIVPTGAAVFDALEGGNGFAFGRMAEKDGYLDNKWKLHSDGDIDTDGDVIAKGNMTADGNVSGAEATFTGDIGAVNMNAGGDVKAVNGVFSGDIQTATANVTGASNFGGDMTVEGKIYPNGGIEGLGITYPKPNETWGDPATGEEQFTGDYWIDGKPIYRRTAKGYMGTTQDTNFSSIGPVESVVKMYGYATFSGRTWRIPVNTYVSSAMYWACWVEDATGTVRTRVNPAGADIWVVIEYTKPD